MPFDRSWIGSKIAAIAGGKCWSGSLEEDPVLNDLGGEIS